MQMNLEILENAYHLQVCISYKIGSLMIDRRSVKDCNKGKMPIVANNNNLIEMHSFRHKKYDRLKTIKKNYQIDR